MTTPASNGVPVGTTGGVATGPQANMNQDYNPHALVGSLLEEEEEPVPLLYFTSVPEAWVGQRPILVAVKFYVAQTMPIASAVSISS